MLTQFRLCYPRGGLISEFVTIDHGKYIVKVSIQIDGMILATGLASGNTVEEAEDQARIRALALLDLSLSDSKIPSASVTSVSEKPVETKIIPQSPEKPLPQKIVPEGKPEVTPPPQKTTAKSAELPIPEKIISEVTPQIPPLEKEMVTEAELTLPIFEDPSQDSLLVTEHSENGIETYTTNLEQSQEVVETKTQPKEPIDFSDVIAQTSVEMKRLGWTNDMGREYVLKTYGKRSRQVLSDEELLEFLEYLKSQ